MAPDVNGNLVQIASPQGTINYAYDPATGAEIEVSTSNTDTHYGYDQAGEMTTVTVTKLNGTALATPLVTAYSYDFDGNLVSTQNANGTTETRTYNDMNEIMSIADTGPFGVYASFTYAYDRAGHVSTETDLGGRTDTYSYDNLYRLTQQTVTSPGVTTRTLTWTYDLVGNRVKSTDSGASANQQSLTYVYNANDELTSLTGSSGYGQTYTYDANGSTLTVTGSGGASSATCTWGPRQRMSGATTGGNTVSYTYDDSDNRLSETVNGSTTKFLNDPNQAYDQVLEEYAPSGVLAATFIRGIDLLFEDQSGARSYYATDNLGSTRALTNSAGLVSDTYNYDAYGNELVKTGTTFNPYLFTGQWWDAAIGQYYVRARDYNAGVGRFTSRDVFQGQASTPLTLNHYVYANTDPENNVDPSGFVSKREGTLIHTAIELMYESDPRNVGHTITTQRGIPRTAGALFPDIMDFTLGEVAEIKPLSIYGVTTGRFQLEAYLGVLNGLTVAYRGKTWTLPALPNEATPPKPWTSSTWAVGVRYIPVPDITDKLVFIVGNVRGVIY